MTYDLNTPQIARLWRYKPDWKAGFTVTREFLTDIITSRSGREQRRALRDVPRMNVGFDAVVGGEDHPAAVQFVRGSQNLPVSIPDYTRYAVTDANAATGATTLRVAAPPAWLAVGQLAVLCGAGIMEQVLIDEIDGDGIGLAGGLDTAWPAGSIIRPAFFGLMDGNTGQKRLKPTASEFGIRLDCYPGGEPPEDAGAPVDVFDGLEVFAADPDWKGSPSIDNLHPVEQVDFVFGRTAQFRPVVRSQQLEQANFNRLARARVLAFEAFFLRQKGRRGTFYRSTCRPDMILAAPATGLGIVVRGGEVQRDYAAVNFALRSQAIEIRQTDGTRLWRKVTDIAGSAGNTFITLDAPVDLSPATTSRISWMPKARFAADALATRWATPNLASIETSFQTVDE